MSGPPPRPSRSFEESVIFVPTTFQSNNARGVWFFCGSALLVPGAAVVMEWWCAVDAVAGWSEVE